MAGVQEGKKAGAKLRLSYIIRFGVLILIFVVALIVSLWMGRYDDLSPVQAMQIIASNFVPMEQTWSDAAANLLWQVRLPRVLAAVMVGAALSVAGAAYQGMFQNPMVSPDVLGATNGAGFGAALGIIMGVGWFGITAQAFAFGLLAVLIAYGVSRMSRTSPILAMVLAGMVVSSLFGSCISYLKLVADTESALPEITYWLMGSLADVHMDKLQLAVWPVLVGLVPLVLLRWRINLLAAGEDEARAMGVNVDLLRAVVIVCATLMTTACVSICGVIGWVGLVIPHFCRMIFGNDFRRIMPAAIFMGAAFLLCADDFARMIATQEIPIGILTSFVGAPVFVFLIVKGGLRREA